MIRLTVRNRTHELQLEMPVTDRPIGPAKVPAYMLDGAVVYVGGASAIEPTDIIVPALTWPMLTKTPDGRDVWQHQVVDMGWAERC